MRPLLLRVLKHGLPTAVLLAVLGYVLAEGAAIWVSSQPSLRPTAGPDAKAVPGQMSSEEFAQQLRNRLPFSLAGWGFGLVLVFEVLLHVWRGGKELPAATPRAAGNVETEKLLNELLERAEAERFLAADKPSSGERGA